MVVSGGPFCSSLVTSGGGGEVSSDVDILCKVFKTGKVSIDYRHYGYTNTTDKMSFYSHYGYTNTIDKMSFYSHYGYTNTIDKMSYVILRSLWVLKYNRFHSTPRNDVINKWIYMYMKLDGIIWHTDTSCNPSLYACSVSLVEETIGGNLYIVYFQLS